MGLTARKVATIKKAGRYGDGHGLYLQVTDAVVKSWLLRFERLGRERWMGLGPIHTVSLAEARERARRARVQLLDGLDPIDQRKAVRAVAALEAARAMPFQKAAREFLAQNEKRWTNVKTLRQASSRLERYVYPVIGKLPVNAIDRGLVLRVLEQTHPDHGGTTTLWQAIPETANRLRGRLEEILAWAAVRGYRSGENPAAWRGNLEHALPAPSKIAKPANHAALPYAEVPSFMEALRAREGVSPRALEFLILTAARAGEVLGASWSEIDLNGRVWTIPASRMKARKEHRVPLSDAAIDVLKSLPREDDNEYIFIGSQRGCGLGHASLGAVLARMRVGVTPHGFRSTFKDWCSETTSFENIVSEMALAHGVGNKVEAAYRRGDLFAKRVRLMDDWARYCTTKPGQAENVVLLRKGVER